MWNWLAEFLDTPTPGAATVSWNGVPCAKGIHVPTPWIVEDFPELAGPELPPPLDYFQDAPDFTNPFNVGWRRLKRCKKWALKIAFALLVLLAPAFFVAALVFASRFPGNAYEYLLTAALVDILACVLLVALVGQVSLKSRFANLPVPLLFRKGTRDTEMALLPFSARDLVLGIAVRGLLKGSISLFINAVVGGLGFAAVPLSGLVVTIVLRDSHFAWFGLGVLVSVSLVAIAQSESGLGFSWLWRNIRLRLRFRLVESFSPRVRWFKRPRLNDFFTLEAYSFMLACLWVTARMAAYGLALIGHGVLLYYTPSWSPIVWLESLILLGLIRSPLSAWVQKYRRFRTRRFAREVERLHQIRQEFFRGAYDNLKDPVPLLRGKIPPIPVADRASSPAASHAV